MAFSQRREHAPDDEEKLIKKPSKRAKCLGCNDGYIWDQRKNRRLKCVLCKGRGYIDR